MYKTAIYNQKHESSNEKCYLAENLVSGGIKVAYLEDYLISTTQLELWASTSDIRYSRDCCKRSQPTASDNEITWYLKEYKSIYITPLVSACGN